MKRALCIWLPHWPLQRLAVTRAELKERAVVLYELCTQGTARVVAYCPRLAGAAAAAWQGKTSHAIRPGMPLAEATALAVHALASARRSPSLARRVSETSNVMADGISGATAGLSSSAPLHLEPADPPGDRLALEALAHWCQRFSPTVGLEEAIQPESLFVDVTGLGRLAGGEESLARGVVAAFLERGLTARVAIADTLSTAWAVAHFAELESGDERATRDEAAILSALRVPRMVPEGQARRAIASLPVEALRLPVEICQRLAELGLRRIDQVAALPRAMLLARFGPTVLVQLDRACGLANEAIVACRPPACWEFEWLFEHPTARREMIEFALDGLVARACEALARERLGVLRLACRMDYEAEPAEQFVVGLYRASANPRHVGDLARLKLERLRLRAPVGAMHTTVLALGPLEFRQQEMFCETEQGPGGAAPGELAALVDRLSNRLGPRAVARPWLLADSQPEFACQYQPLASLSSFYSRGGRRSQKPRGLRSRKKSSAAKSDQHRQDTSATPEDALLDRPLHLEPRPRPLVVVSVAPEGPPMKFLLAGQDERVVRVWGPERIETGWWRTRLVRRDYYQVETARGARYWLFRELAGGTWFLHGEFA